MVRFLILILMMTFVSACASVKLPGMGGDNASSTKLVEVPQISVLGWVPNYAQPINFLETLLAEQKSSSSKAQTISQIAYLYDGQLYVLFHEMLDYLPNTARHREIEEQNAWLDKRQDAVKEVFGKYQDDSADVGAYHAAEEFIAQTRQRTALIEERLARVRID